jgi:hypothetical protein
MAKRVKVLAGRATKPDVRPFFAKAVRVKTVFRTGDDGASSPESAKRQRVVCEVPHNSCTVSLLSELRNEEMRLGIRSARRTTD